MEKRQPELQTFHVIRNCGGGDREGAPKGRKRKNQTESATTLRVLGLNQQRRPPAVVPVEPKQNLFVGPIRSWGFVEGGSGRTWAAAW